ncbi:hypothetical protein CYMTET_36534, partial [Cymbomonas tetramitiformis]
MNAWKRRNCISTRRAAGGLRIQNDGGLGYRLPIMDDTRCLHPRTCSLLRSTSPGVLLRHAQALVIEAHKRPSQLALDPAATSAQDSESELHHGSTKLDSRQAMRIAAVSEKKPNRVACGEGGNDCGDRGQCVCAI